MAVSGPTKQCPRCNTQLPADAVFCGTCGLQFAPPFAPAGAPQTTAGFAPFQAAGPGAPGGWGPPGQPAFPQPVAPAAPAKRSKTLLIVAIVVIVVLLGGGAAGAFFFLKGKNSQTTTPPGVTVDRHGLPNSIPLPDSVTFKVKQTVQRSLPGAQLKLNSDNWVWTVASPHTPENLQQFYITTLPQKGWTNPQPQTSANGERDVLACQGQQILLVSAAPSLTVSDAQGNQSMTINAPPGGSALGIAILQTDSPLVLAALCGGLQPTP